MTDDTLKNILSLADDDYIAADPLSAPVPQKTRKVDVKRVLLVAAVLAVLVSATVIVADALEYNQIIIYLSERNISVDGMTRSEIKEAYWSIKKGTWNIKTTDFTGNGSDAAFVISGNEIMLPRPDPLPAEDKNPVAVVDSNVNEDGCLVIVTADGETRVTEMPSNPIRAEIVYDGMTFSIEKSDLVGAYNGKLYISATLSNFHGIDHGNVLESCRETIASVLFVCDPKKGLEDYTLIRGCVGGDMEVRDGTLCWHVGSIASAISVAMGHCSVEGMAQVYEIAFQGDTIRVYDTGVLAGWDNGFWML